MNHAQRRAEVRKNDPHRAIPVTEKEPPQDTVILVWRKDGAREQVEIRDGKSYLWRYRSTDEAFCDESEIKAWRFCSGFDF